MTAAKQLQQLFTYDLWANKKVCAILASENVVVPEKTKLLFAHIRASQQIWYGRIVNHPVKTELWPQNTLPVGDLDQLQTAHKKWLTLLLNKSEDLDEPVSYQNSKGEKFGTPLAGILHHLIIHDQHHRAQIAMLLRENDIEPPATDFIFYLRDKNAR